MSTTLNKMVSYCPFLSSSFPTTFKAKCWQCSLPIIFSYQYNSCTSFVSKSTSTSCNDRKSQLLRGFLLAKLYMKIGLAKLRWWFRCFLTAVLLSLTKQNLQVDIVEKVENWPTCFSGVQSWNRQVHLSQTDHLLKNYHTLWTGCHY